MDLQSHLNDPRLRRVRRLSLGVRVTILVLGALMGTLVLTSLVGISSGSLETLGGFRVTVTDSQVRTQGEFKWQDFVQIVFWMPLLGLGVAIFQQAERLLASYQRGVILDAGNARRIGRIGLFLIVLSVLLTVWDMVETTLSASLGIPQSGPITVELPWILAGLVVMAIGYAMGIACDIAEDAELTV